jgi:uncharacterized membrane protein
MTTSTEQPPAHRGDRRPGARWSWLWVALSSTAIAAYFVGQYADGSLTELAGRGVGLASTYAHRPLPVQVAFYAHISCSGLALLIGPFQFSRRLRTRRPTVHRWVGHVYLLGVAVGAIAAFVMSMFSSVALAGFFGFGALAVLWGATAWRGYLAVRDRDIRSHQAWMIRNFALTYAAVTLRLWGAALILIQLPFSHADYQTVFDTAYAPLPFLCWLPNIVIAEFMIRKRRLPALRLDNTATRRTAT